MSTITLRGVITDGVGKHVELHVPGRNEISQAPDDWPVTLQQGSLNVRIESGRYPSLFASAGLPVLVKSLDARPFPAAFEIAQDELGNNRLVPTPQMPHRGSAQVWRASLVVRGERHPCWVLRRFGSGVGEQLELLSHLHMRSSFKLVNGEQVEVVMQRGNAQPGAQADSPAYGRPAA